jgi:hypothetical protein
MEDRLQDGRGVSQTVVARLDRAIQYAAAFVFIIGD